MAFIKSYTSREIGFTFEEAYHRINFIDESKSHVGEVSIFFHVYANKESASRPSPVVESKVGEDGSEVLTEIPNPRRSVAEPVGSYSVVISDPAVSDSLLLKKSPISAPTGTTDRERYNPKAQAYRFVRSLDDFRDAIDLK